MQGLQAHRIFVHKAACSLEQNLSNLNGRSTGVRTYDGRGKRSPKLRLATGGRHERSVDCDLVPVIPYGERRCLHQEQLVLLFWIPPHCKYPQGNHE